MKIHCKYDNLVKLEDFVPHPKNRNKHPKEQTDRLVELYKYHGIRHPIIVSALSGCIVAGHGRLEAAKKAGLKEFPAVLQEFENEEKEYAFLQADNAIALWAELDLSGINTDIGDFGPGFDIDMLGIKNFVLEPAEKLEPGCDEDDVPEHVEPKTKLGDIYKLGNHRLLCGDSTIYTDIERLFVDKKADMIWTDPPYNVAYEGKTKEALKIQNDSMDGDSFYKFLYDAYTAMFMVTKPGGSIYVAHADSEGANFRKAMVDSGFLLKQCIIWVKNSIVMGRQDYHWQHEPILYGWAPGASHNWYSDRKQSTVFNCKRPQRNAEHPTMKPVELIEYFIGNSSQPGELVFDPFGGSGSTMIAAEKSGRVSYLCELDPKYCDVIVARWEKFTGKKAELING